MLSHGNGGYANAPQYYVIRLVYNRSQFIRRAVKLRKLGLDSRTVFVSVVVDEVLLSLHSCYRAS